MNKIDTFQEGDLSTLNSITESLINLKQEPHETSSFESRAQKIFSSVEKLPFNTAVQALTKFYSENASCRLNLSRMAMKTLDKSLASKKSSGIAISEEDNLLVKELFERVSISFDEARNSPNGQMGSNVEVGFLEILSNHPELIAISYLPLSNILGNLQKNDSEILSFNRRVRNIFAAIELLPAQDTVDALAQFYSMNSQHSLELTFDAMLTLQTAINKPDSDSLNLRQLFNSIGNRYALARQNDVYNYPNGISKILEFLEKNPVLYKDSGQLLSDILVGYKKIPLDSNDIFQKKISAIFLGVEKLPLNDGLAAITNFLNINSSHNIEYVELAINSVKQITSAPLKLGTPLSPQEEFSLRDLIETFRTITTDQIPADKVNLIRTAVAEINLKFPNIFQTQKLATKKDKDSLGLPTIPDILLNEYGIAREERIRLVNSINEAGLSIDEQRILYKLLSPVHGKESDGIDNDKTSLVINKLTTESLNELIATIIAKGSTLRLAMILAVTPKSKLKPKILDYLGISEEENHLEGNVSIGHNDWYLCGNAEPRMSTSIREGGYVILKPKNSSSETGIVIKMYGKITGLVTSTLQIGDHLVPKGVYISPVGNTKTLIQAAFKNGENIIEISGEDLQFALMREVDTIRTPELLETAVNIVQQTPKPRELVAGMSRSEYLIARFEWE